MAPCRGLTPCASSALANWISSLTFGRFHMQRPDARALWGPLKPSHPRNPCGRDEWMDWAVVEEKRGRLARPVPRYWGQVPTSYPRDDGLTTPSSAGRLSSRSCHDGSATLPRWSSITTTSVHSLTYELPSSCMRFSPRPPAVNGLADRGLRHLTLPIRTLCESCMDRWSA